MKLLWRGGGGFNSFAVDQPLNYRLNNIIIRFGTKLYKQIVGIPRGKNYAPLIADFLFCYEKDFIASFSDDGEAEINSTS